VTDRHPIPGFPHYRATREGQIWSDYTGTWLRPSIFTGGYLGVTLYENKKRFPRTVHALVAITFLGPRPEGYEIRHLNGDPTDSRAENLAYGTHSENMLDKVKHGTHHLANRTHCPKGHPYSGDNLIIESDGGRKCRTCKNDRKRSPEYLAKQRLRQKAAREAAAATRAPRELKTHCKHGHPYDEENTRVRTNGGRVCRTCHRDRERGRTSGTVRHG